MQEVALVNFAQQVAEHLVLQRRTDGPGSVYHLRKDPNIRVVTQKKQLKSTQFSAGISVAFDNGVTVAVAASTLTGSISQCCVFARPHVVEHGEWTELQDGDPISHSFSGEELHKLREALRVKDRRDHEFSGAGC
jgi:hypothetical protein